MRTKERSKCDAVVEVVDLTKPIEEVTAYLQKQKPDANIVGAETLGDFGLVNTEEGWYFINSEGVMSRDPLADNEDGVAYTLPFYSINGDGAMSFMPAVEAHLSLEKILELPTSKHVPIAEYIRKFGSRLEANYHICTQALNKSKPLPPRDLVLAKSDD